MEALARGGAAASVMVLKQTQTLTAASGSSVCLESAGGRGRPQQSLRSRQGSEGNDPLELLLVPPPAHYASFLAS